MPAYSSYLELKQAIARWLNREDDPDIDARAAEFIALCEARIRRNQEWFTEVWSLQNSGEPYAITDEDPIELPAYIDSITDVWLDTGVRKRPIPVVTLAEWRDRVASNEDATGIPQLATMVSRKSAGLGPVLYLWPRPAGTVDDPFLIDFQYVRSVPELSTDFASNGMITRHPDLYLYGALVESAPFYEHDERLALWETRYAQAMAEINIEHERTMFGATLKRPRLPRVF